MLTSVMAATVYAIVYLFSESLSSVYLEGYHFSTRQASLVMLALSVGVICSRFCHGYTMPDSQLIAIGGRSHRAGR